MRLIDIDYMCLLSFITFISLLYVLVCSTTANSDIYFDESLYRLGNMSKTLNKQTVFALTKWVTVNDDVKGQGIQGVQMKPEYPSLNLILRIESQDAWIFKVPMAQQVIDHSTFHIGKSRCDNALAAVFVQCGYAVYNPAFAIRAIEIDSRGRKQSLYDATGVDLSVGSSYVFFSDEFI